MKFTTSNAPGSSPHGRENPQGDKDKTASPPTRRRISLAIKYALDLLDEEGRSETVIVYVFPEVSTQRDDAPRIAKVSEDEELTSP
jgi:hypothetical protein